MRSKPNAPDGAAAKSDTEDRGGSTQASSPALIGMSLRQDIPGGFAVGMTIADHPPHRSVLAELPHTAPPLDSSVEANIWIRMKSTRARNPSIKDRPQLFPIGLPPLTTTT